MITVSKIIIWSVLSVLLISCNANAPRPTEKIVPAATSLPTLTPTPELAVTLTATEAPTNTHTPLPPTETPTTTPQGMHTWHPSLVLVRNQKSIPTIIQPPPDLVIFFDGLVVISEYSKESGYTPMGTQLNRNELCKILNTIDQYGFFEFNSSTYIEPIEDLSVEMIEVNAWNTNRVDGNYLYCWTQFNDPLVCCPGMDVDSCKPPVVMPALAKTYAFLSSYRPEGLEPLQIEAVIVDVSIHENFEAYEESPTFINWPLPEFPLEKLYEMLAESDGFDPIVFPPLVFKGEDLKLWLRFMPNGIYRDGDFIARVSSRPLWPHEQPSASTMFTDEDQSVVPEDFTLTCTSEDGWIE